MKDAFKLQLVTIRFCYYFLPASLCIQKMNKNMKMRTPYFSS